jgi:hypothetical protein
MERRFFGSRHPALQPAHRRALCRPTCSEPISTDRLLRRQCSCTPSVWWTWSAWQKKTLVSQVEPLVCVEEQRHPDQSGHDDATATSRGTRPVHHQRTLLVGRATQQLNLRRRAQTASMLQRKIDNIRHAVENESVRRRSSKPHVARKKNGVRSPVGNMYSPPTRSAM